MIRFVVFCLVLLAPAAVRCQNLTTEDGSFLFTIPNAGDLLNGKILGQSLDEVLDAQMAAMLQDAGFTFSDEAITFQVKVDDEPVDRRKCLYEAELQEAVVKGEVDATQPLEFKANTSFIVEAEAFLPLTMNLTGKVETKLFVPLFFACPEANTVEVPVDTSILADVFVKVVVFLNPEIVKRKNKVFLKVFPKIKIFEEVQSLAASSDVEFEVFDSVRVTFVENLIEDIADEAIEKRGAGVLSKLVKQEKKKLQKFLDENLAGEEIDLGGLIADAEEAGALEDLVLLAKLGFAVL